MPWLQQDTALSSHDTLTKGDTYVREISIFKNAPFSLCSVRLKHYTLQPTNGLATRFRQYGREEGRSRVRKSGSGNLNSFRKIASDSSIRRILRSGLSGKIYDKGSYLDVKINILLAAFASLLMCFDLRKWAGIKSLIFSYMTPIGSAILSFHQSSQLRVATA